MRGRSERPARSLGSSGMSPSGLAGKSTPAHRRWGTLDRDDFRWITFVPLFIIRYLPTLPPVRARAAVPRHLVFGPVRTLRWTVVLQGVGHHLRPAQHALHPAGAVLDGELLDL